MCLLVSGYGGVGEGGVGQGGVGWGKVGWDGAWVRMRRNKACAPKSVSDLSIKPHEHEQGPLKEGTALENPCLCPFSK